LAVLLGIATAYGLVVQDAYPVHPGIREDFRDVMRGQDLFTLVTVPVLVVAAWQARSGSFRFHLIWLGLALYYGYSYVMYAFSPYNDAFLVYVAIISMSGFGMLDGLFRIRVGPVAPAIARYPQRAVGLFLITVGSLFAVLWLAMLVPAILGDDLPGGRMVYDIPSAVHVLDLSLMLPLLACTGVQLLRRRAGAAILAPVLLCKIVTIGLALLSMNLAFAPEPSAAEVSLWAVVAGVAAGILAVVLRRIGEPGDNWLSSGVWH
jgi:hypothetical protein